MQKSAFSVIVISGGIAGVLAAIRLAEAGIAYTVIEKNQSVGGTWFENRYPGAQVDVANHLYSYSFASAHHWTKYFSQQPELQACFEDCIDRFDVRKKLPLFHRGHRLQLGRNTAVPAYLYSQPG